MGSEFLILQMVGIALDVLLSCLMAPLALLSPWLWLRLRVSSSEFVIHDDPTSIVALDCVAFSTCLRLWLSSRSEWLSLSNVSQ